jgi:hypothetical protein
MVTGHVAVCVTSSNSLLACILGNGSLTKEAGCPRTIKSVVSSDSALRNWDNCCDQLCELRPGLCGPFACTDSEDSIWVHNMLPDILMCLRDGHFSSLSALSMCMGSNFRYSHVNSAYHTLPYSSRTSNFIYIYIWWRSFTVPGTKVAPFP